MGTRKQGEPVMVTDITNETGEKLVIKPGESVRVKVDDETKKGTVSRRRIFKIEEINDE